MFAGLVSFAQQLVSVFITGPLPYAVATLGFGYAGYSFLWRGMAFERMAAIVIGCVIIGGSAMLASTAMGGGQ